MSVLKKWGIVQKIVWCPLEKPRIWLLLAPFPYSCQKSKARKAQAW